jgi:hypothetical protein
MNPVVRAMHQRQMLQTGYSGNFYSTPLISRPLISTPLTNTQRVNLSGQPRQSLAKQIFEQADDLAVKTFAPPLYPLFKGVEMLEESPNTSPQERSGLELLEFLILCFCAYKAFK